MTGLASEPKQIENLPTPGLIEGPFLFERKGVYYLTFPHVNTVTERLEYLTSDRPTGPFRTGGILMDESPSGCWTVHQSVVQFNGHWYLFYHDNDLSPKFDKHRSVRADEMFFNSDGTIQKVRPTLRGIGIANALGQIQIDRYSDISHSAPPSASLTIRILSKAGKFALTAKIRGSVTIASILARVTSTS